MPRIDGVKLGPLRVDGVRVDPYRRLDVTGAAPPPRERTETQFRLRSLPVVASELTLGAKAYSGRVVMQGGVGQVARRPSSKQAGLRQDAVLYRAPRPSTDPTFHTESTVLSSQG